MKVFVLYQNIDSGAKIATEQIIEAFNKMNPKLETSIYKQNPYKYSGWLSFTRNLLWSTQDFVKQINKIEKIDAIYSPYYLVKLSQLLSNKKNIPFYFHLHGDQSLTQFEQKKIKKWNLQNIYTFLIHFLIKNLQKMTLQKSEKIFFVSEKAKTSFCRKNKLKLSKEKIAIVPNGVSLEKFFPVSQKKKQEIKKRILKSESENFIISYIGRIDHKKGILELIQSFQYVKEKKITLLIVYPNIPDKYSQNYLALLKKYAKKSEIKVVFKKNPQKISQYYQASELIILPSRQEMMPLVMLEAFACKIPFIGSTVGNMPTILKQVNKNLILQEISPREIGRKIQWFLTLSKQEKEDLLNKEKAISQNFSWKKAATKIFVNFGY